MLLCCIIADFSSILKKINFECVLKEIFQNCWKLVSPGRQIARLHLQSMTVWAQNSRPTRKILEHEHFRTLICDTKKILHLYRLQIICIKHYWKLVSTGRHSNPYKQHNSLVDRLSQKIQYTARVMYLGHKSCFHLYFRVHATRDGSIANLYNRNIERGSASQIKTLCKIINKFLSYYGTVNSPLVIAQSCV